MGSGILLPTMWRASVAGWGKALPQRVLTNAQIEAMVDTSDEWIRTRTGIRERRIAGPDESTFTLATEAGRQALAVAGVGAESVDRLAMAQGTIAAGVFRRVLVIGAETMSRLLDWRDRSTCVLFGDGAGAVLLEAGDGPDGLLSCVLGSDGSGGELLWIPGGGSRRPASVESVTGAQHYIRMNGKEVYRFAVTVAPRAALQAVQQAGLTVDDVDLFIPHQANMRIMLSAAASLGISPERTFVNLDRYGNTSAASIPIALCEAVESGRIGPGDDILMTGFGGGLSWGAAVLRWRG